MRRTGGFGGMGCGCSRPPVRSAQNMDGIFSMALNVAGAFVGDPMLGNQIAAKAGGAYAQISETSDEIALRVAPRVQAVLSSGALPDPTKITPQAQQIGASIAADVAMALKQQGITLPPGTVGGDMQQPSLFSAFGGEYQSLVKVGGLALAGLLLLKVVL